MPPVADARVATSHFAAFPLPPLNAGESPRSLQRAQSAIGCGWLSSAQGRPINTGQSLGAVREPVWSARDPTKAGIEYGSRPLNVLSVLLPVYNAQGKLEADVTEILEVLSEAARRFELCILDDGSTDDTADVAHLLSARYPQVRVIRHPVRLGLSEAIQTGLDHTHGEVIVVGDEDYCLDPDDLRTLWQLRDTQWQLTRKDSKGIVAQPWMEKLLAWKPRSSDVRRGFQIISRQAFEQFRLRQAVDQVHRLDIGWHNPARAAIGPKFAVANGFSPVEQ